jgi:hypothetical protein
MSNTPADLPPIARIQDVPKVCDCNPGRRTYIVNPFAPRGTVNAVCGPPGSGKTGLLMHFGNRAAANGAQVVFSDRESPLLVVQEYMVRLHVEDGPNLHYYGTWLDPWPFGPTDQMARMFVRESEKPVLFIFDPLVAFQDGMASNKEAIEMRAFMSAFRGLANLGATVLLVHHSPKSGGSYYMGSTDLEASVDNLYYITREPKTGHIRKVNLEVKKSRFGLTGTHTFTIGHDGRFIDSQNPEETIITILRQHPGLSSAEFDKLTVAAGLSRKEAREFLDLCLRAGTVQDRRGGASHRNSYFVEGQEQEEAEPQTPQTDKGQQSRRVPLWSKDFGRKKPHAD